MCAACHLSHLDRANRLLLVPHPNSNFTKGLAIQRPSAPFRHTIHIICTHTHYHITLMFKMARPIKPAAPPSPEPTGASTTSKPLPEPSEQQPQRPGTSGTEAALKTSRRRATEQLRHAERAERVYRAKKRAAATRANYTEAKAHLRQAREHLGLGVRLLVAVVKGTPFVVREKWEGRRVQREEAKRKKVMEMKRRLDEKLASGGGEEDGELEESSARGEKSPVTEGIRVV